MIEHLDTYKTFVQDILRKSPIMHTQQIIICLCKTYEGMTENKALDVLRILQSQQCLIMSEDGYSLTRPFYCDLTSDTFYDNINETAASKLSNFCPPSTFTIVTNIKLSNGNTKRQKSTRQYSLDELIDNKRQNILQMMWIVADMMPDSENFIIGCSPWDVLFSTPCDETNGKLYQLMYIPENEEISKSELIRCLPAPYNDEAMSSLVRIAVIENAEHAWRVPHLGFHFILKMNPDVQSHYSIVEKRTGEDIWSDL